MKKFILNLFLLSVCAVSAQEITESVITLDRKPWGPMVYPTALPDSCPVKQSEDLVGIEFTGRHADYTHADTWYPTWASDGNLYSPYTDGVGGGIWNLGRSKRTTRSLGQTDMGQKTKDQ